MGDPFYSFTLKKRRVIILRRALKGDVVISEKHRDQIELGFVETNETACVEIDFGVKEGRSPMPVSEHIGNGFKGMALLEHAGCEVATKDMRSLMGPQSPPIALLR